MNSTLTSFSENFENIADVCVASIGTICIFVCICRDKIRLSIISVIYTIVAVVHSSVKIERNTLNVLNAFVAADSICGVLTTFLCGIELNLHKTTIGIFRILWLVLLITSSSSYAAIATITNQDFIPNDISIISIVVSTIILILLSIISRLRKKQKEDDEIKVINLAAEYSLVCGALILRFENELFQILNIKIGWICWHLACWVCILLCSV